MAIIYCHCWCKERYPADTDQYEERLGDISARISVWLKETGYVEEKTGLYLATLNAGVHECISFWEQALIHSPRYANPANFNMTLSNGSAGLLSRLLQIKGPCYILVGKSQAIEGCLFHAFTDFEAGSITTAIISGLDKYDKDLHFCACLLSHLPGKSIITMDPTKLRENGDEYASEFLYRMLSLLP